MMNLLNCIPLLLIKLQAVLENSFCRELWLNSIPMIIAFLGIGLAAFLAYRFAIKQKKEEIFIGLERIKYERKLAAIEACWKLLAYTTDTENDNSVLIWEQYREDKTKAFYINTENAGEFIKRLAAFFYGSGLGIYLSQDTKKLLFEYRGNLFGFLLSVKNSNEKLIRIKKVQMHQRMVAIHQELILRLKNETEVINKPDKKNGH